MLSVKFCLAHKWVCNCHNAYFQTVLRKFCIKYKKDDENENCYFTSK